MTLPLREESERASAREKRTKKRKKGRTCERCVFFSSLDLLLFPFSFSSLLYNFEIPIPPQFFFFNSHCTALFLSFWTFEREREEATRRTKDWPLKKKRSSAAETVRAAAVPAAAELAPRAVAAAGAVDAGAFVAQRRDPGVDEGDCGFWRARERGEEERG